VAWGCDRSDVLHPAGADAPVRRVGGRSSAAGVPALPGLLLIGESNTVYVYDVEGNRVDTNAPQCVYDPLGRLIQKQTEESITTYDYDVEGYLVGYARIPIHGTTGSPQTEDTTLKTVRPERVVGSLEINFTYDPLGRRRTKHYRDSTQEYHHRYGYSSEAIIAIYDNNTNELLATLLHDEAIDAPLCINVNPTQPMNQEESIEYETMDDTQKFMFTQSRIKRYYYHRDYQNSVIALSDDDGNIVEHYTYDAFGNITHEEHYKQINTLNPYRYTGREFDTDDLYYYRARYYDPTLGAFTSPDPIGFLGGDMNLYRYVGNDPVNYVDPSGLIVLEALEGIAGFADSLTMGASGKIAEVINARIYGASIAQATTAQIANSTAGQVGGILADVVTLPKTAVKKLAQKGIKELAQNNAKQAVKKIEKKAATKGGAANGTGAKVAGKKLSNPTFIRQTILLKNAGNPAEYGVIDGARTHDNWNHNPKFHAQ
jgi:RHS repeat-associated protein